MEGGGVNLSDLKLSGLKKADCEKVIRSCWKNDSTLDLPEMIDYCAAGLMDWGGSDVRKIKERIRGT